MKKNYKLAALALLSLPSFAQTAFFAPTAYRGAFAPAPTAMWTDTWTEWDPQNKTYPVATQSITSNITSNTTWTTGQTYLLQGQIYVKNNAVLTIQPGVVILGDKNTAGSGLFITKGSRIEAVGTVNNPIVFTSDQDPGFRDIGDWGGLILLGKGANNQPGGIGNIEGIAPSADTEFGGGASPDNNDNSGTLKYVRIEFGGYVYQPNKEINGLTFGSVGKGTTIDNVQVSYSNDDAFEWFGGAVECRHLVSYRNLDDDFDTDFGFSGKVQFALSVRDPQIADNPSVSTSEGFESDNDATGTANGPLTSAIFSNVTLIGPYRGNTGATIATGYRRGARIRRNSNLKIFNSVFMDHVRGIHIDGTACEANAASGALKVKYNIVAGNSTGKATEVNSGSTFNAPSWFAVTSTNDSLVSTSNILITPYNFTTPDYRPTATSIALTGADFNDPTFAGDVLAVRNLISIENLFEVFPNPASSKTTIMFNTDEKTIISVSVYDVLGDLVTVVNANNQFEKGNHSIEINTSNLANGIYHISLNMNGAVGTKKLIVNN